MPEAVKELNLTKIVSESPSLQDKLKTHIAPPEAGNEDGTESKDEQGNQNQNELANKEGNEVKQPPEDTDENAGHYEESERGKKIRKRPFVKKALHEAEDARKRAERAEQDLDASRKKIEEYEARIKEFEGKQDKALTEEAERKWQERIDELNSKLEKELAERDKKEKLLEERISFHDLRESPRFQREFVQPIVDAQKNIASIIGNNEEMQRLFSQAINAHGASLYAQEDQAEHYANIRDEALSQIVESVPKFRQGRITSLFNTYIDATYKHAGALQDWQNTKATHAKQAEEESRTAQTKLREKWENELKQTKQEVEEEIPIPDELQSIIDSEKIEVDYADDQRIMQACLGAGRATDREVSRFINQGLLYRRAKGVITALQHQVQELQKTIDKQRGSDPGQRGGGSGSGSNGNANKDGKNLLNEKFSRFSRRG